MTSLSWFAVLQSLISAGPGHRPLGAACAARPAAILPVVGLGVDRVRGVSAAGRVDAAAVGEVEPCRRHAGVSGHDLWLSAAGAPDGRRRQPAILHHAGADMADGWRLHRRSSPAMVIFVVSLALPQRHRQLLPPCGAARLGPGRRCVVLGRRVCPARTGNAFAGLPRDRDLLPGVQPRSGGIRRGA